MANNKAKAKLGLSRWLNLVLALALVLSGGSAFLNGAGAWAEESARKLRSSMPPEYPELARKLNIRGTARVEVTVAPDGTVRKVKEVGGNPVLVEALVRAVKKWKYEPAARESVFEVKFEFVP
jgi:TonB family protein